MSNKEARLYLRYFLWAVGSVAVAFLLSLATHTNNDVIEWGEIVRETAKATAGILTLLLGAMNIPRIGSAQLAEDVDALRDRGVHRDEMRPVARTTPVARTAAEQILNAADAEAAPPPAFLPEEKYPGRHDEGRG